MQFKTHYIVFTVSFHNTDTFYVKEKVLNYPFWVRVDLHTSQVLIVFTFVLLNKVISILLGVCSSRRKILWFQFLLC